MGDLILAIDQGTTSTRCMLLDADGPRHVCQAEHRQFFPQPGWVEHDPMEIWHATSDLIRRVLSESAAAPADIAAIGITNQRETIVAWDKFTGRPLHNAIVWQDTRTMDICQRLGETAGRDRFRAATGLPLATYFSGPKIRWLLDNVPAVAHAARNGSALCGTIDCWLLWQLAGGAAAQVHLTDVTNAGRTMLMNLASLDWDDAILTAMQIPREMLPRIRPSIGAEPFTMTAADGPLGGRVPIRCMLGDQHAALIGQACFEPGESKNTYGTGCFMLMNTGTTPVPSSHGLLTTVAYQFAGQPAVYALEGSIADTGSLVQWFRDNLGLIPDSASIESLARQCPDNGDVYIVPAFSGLYAPFWRPEARGLIIGLTRHTTKAHLARAALEATAYQTRCVLDAMVEDSGVPLRVLQVDGGMTANELLMQFQADILNVPVRAAAVRETTALGAAYGAAIASGLRDIASCRTATGRGKTWNPSPDAQLGEKLLKKWKKAAHRSFDWIAPDSD
jgi:glycerol kinase